MKLAIHHRPNSFSDRWIAYCVENNISFKLVNCYKNDIIHQVNECDALVWHHHHGDFKDVITAKKILFALEHAGIKVFPDFKTSWHFDDKVAQKYLLEAIAAPLVPSFVFYDKQQALEWAEKTSYPKVFKLKGGAGSTNVKLIRSKSQCFKLIHKSFGKGFKQFDSWENLKEIYSKYKSKNASFKNLLGSIYRMVVSTKFANLMPREKGYTYFQEFIPNNDSDIRIIVIGNKAFALKRMVRKDDFRASGSGRIIYEKNQIDERCVQIAFETNNKINAQSIAYDFVFDKINQPLIIEISYGFSVAAYDQCEGYWDNELNWFEGKFNPQEWMIEELLR
jgi:glutathione synthase/RimK-type ligase-like ATP-grasp enzyme